MKYVKGQFVICLCALAVIAVCRCIDDKLFQEKPKEYKAFFTPGTDCEMHIIAAIKRAARIDVAVYSITHPDITDAIIDAHNRGANIRIVTDRMMTKNKGSLVGKLRNAGIPVLTNKKHKIEHNKFAVFDDVHVVSGSYNWTTNASKYNSENCVFFDQQNKEYTHRFEYLWDLYQK
jgi:phosphatidylserine/phosphatidylglycerophosphate/cardiolipin synthase-like enzyme